MTGSDSPRRVGPPPPTVRALDIDGDVSLYDSATRQAVVLNSTASDVWHLLDGEHTLEGVVTLVARAYAVEPATIRGDVERTVTELRAAGFLAP